MASRGRVFPGVQHRRPVPQIVVVGGSVVVIILLGIVGYSMRLRSHAYSLQNSETAETGNMLNQDAKEKLAGLNAEKSRLLQQINEWNQKAEDIGLASHKLSVLDTATGSTTSAVVASNTQPGSCEKGPLANKYPMKTPAQVEQDNPELAAAVKKYAKNDEIMLTLANGVMICQNTTICWWNGGNILQSFLEILEHNKITNYVIGVMDDETEKYLAERNANQFRVNIKIPQSQKNTHPANRVSTIKYTLLRQLIQLGYNTYITDMDLVYMSNPFNHLHRDSDIEIQTDGFDDTAYGIIEGVHDPSMGWGAGGLYMKLFTTNVGAMYAKANHRTFALMNQVADYLSANSGWDQQVFNEFLIKPSYKEFVHSGSSFRVMDYMKFMNSKIFFKSRRGEFLPGAQATGKTPVMVHFNYHPDKHKRMLCIIDRYFKGNVSACDHFPPGSDKP
mmetsp:Transcript_18645/g.40053  ORF Transcript_18645/g.40053 Transcript_18645/m.40053 type:complete len:447 (+) Transcript_18645:53-1393(+)